MLEHPIFVKGFWDVNKSKQKKKPEGFRVIFTETTKKYCGVISHNGILGKALVKKDKKKKITAEVGTLGETSRGDFHKCA